MASFKPLMPFLRPLGAPRASYCRQAFRFSTATRLRVDQSTIPNTSPTAATPSSTASPRSTTASPVAPQDASSTADQAAVEAATDADSAQSPAPKPILPSDHNALRDKAQSSNAASEAASSSQEVSAAADQAAVEAATDADSAQSPASKPVLPSKRPKSSKPDKSNKPGKGANPERQSKAAAQANAANVVSPKPRSRDFKPVPASRIPLTYHVARSNANNYPIYTDYKRGGNLHLTTIRKITGDAEALRDDIQVFLNKKDGDVKVNPLNQHVIIKGHHVPQITEFLKERGM